MSDAVADALLHDFGALIGIESLDLDPDGRVTLEIDGAVELVIEVDEPEGWLMLSAALGQLPSPAPAELLGELLDANLLFQGTDGATIGADANSGAVVLSQALTLEGGDGPPEPIYDALRWGQRNIGTIQTVHAPPDVAQGIFGFAADRLSTPGPVPRGRFYIEAQSQAQCPIHALNALVGGPISDVGSVNRMLELDFYGPHTGPGAKPPKCDSAGGAEPEAVFKYIDWLHEMGLYGRNAGPPFIETIIPGVSGDLDTALAKISDHGCIVHFQSPSPHFVTFRKDEDDNWVLLDSLRQSHPTECEDVQIGMSPEAFLQQRLIENPNQLVAIVGLEAGL
jgi:hypothetical protein